MKNQNAIFSCNISEGTKNGEQMVAQFIIVKFFPPINAWDYHLAAKVHLLMFLLHLHLLPNLTFSK